MLEKLYTLQLHAEVLDGAVDDGPVIQLRKFLAHTILPLQIILRVTFCECSKAAISGMILQRVGPQSDVFSL